MPLLFILLPHTYAHLRTGPSHRPDPPPPWPSTTAPRRHPPRPIVAGEAVPARAVGHAIAPHRGPHQSPIPTSFRTPTHTYAQALLTAPTHHRPSQAPLPLADTHPAPYSQVRRPWPGRSDTRSRRAAGLTSHPTPQASASFRTRPHTYAQFRTLPHTSAHLRTLTHTYAHLRTAPHRPFLPPRHTTTLFCAFHPFLFYSHWTVCTDIC